MTSGEEKSKGWRIWRPRFSVRTLAIVVTLVCAYFGAWEATKKWGVPANSFLKDGRSVTASSPAPFMIRYDIGDEPFGGLSARLYVVWPLSTSLEPPSKSGKPGAPGDLFGKAPAPAPATPAASDDPFGAPAPAADLFGNDPFR